MAFTVSDLHDLIQVLEQRPELKQMLRAVLLTEELLNLPQLVAQLVEIQRQQAQKLEAMRSELLTRLDATRDELRNEFRTQLDATRDELRNEFRTQLDATRDELRNEFRTQLEATRNERVGGNATMRRDRSNPRRTAQRVPHAVGGNAQRIALRDRSNPHDCATSSARSWRQRATNCAQR
jgi:small-conductance mechanosensitive channel